MVGSDFLVDQKTFGIGKPESESERGDIGQWNDWRRLWKNTLMITGSKVWFWEQVVEIRLWWELWKTLVSAVKSQYSRGVLLTIVPQVLC